MYVYGGVFLKKYFVLTLTSVFLIIFMLLLSSCKYKCELYSSDIISYVLNTEQSQSYDVYVGYGFSSDSFSEKELERFYGVYDAAYKCTDYAAAFSRSDNPWEIHIFRTRSLYDNKSVVSMLRRRADFITKEENNNYIGKTIDYIIFEEKNIICLVVGERCNTYRERICNLIKNKSRSL